MKTRREFLRSSGLIALAPLVPTFLDELARAAGAKPDARILVVIQLEGGNDGINTIVPFADPAYALNRPNLRIRDDEVLKINDRVGFNPAMRGMADLLQDGRLAIVQGVGYPNPNRSHFESMHIWQTGRLDGEKTQIGWIGSALDGLPKRPASAPAGPDAIYVGDEELPVALTGNHAEAAAISGTDDLALRLPTNDAGDMQRDPSTPDATAFAHRSVLRAYGTARDLARTPAAGTAANATYPATQLGKQLGVISQIIKSGAGTRVYYASQRSYDTHFAQLPRHADLLRELSGGVKAFLDDLRTSGLSDRVLLMTFSEFGRRVAENGSFGTDHGAAAPVFLAGDAVTAGLIGNTPSLADLDAGDIKSSIDFRRIYAALLKQWLQIPRGAATATFDPLPFLRV